MSVLGPGQSMEGRKRWKSESRGHGRIVSAWIIAALLVCWVGDFGRGAAGQANAPGAWIGNARRQTGANSPPTPQLSAKQLHQLNELRQKQLVADTDRLLQLARELNHELDGAGTDLSPEQMNKVSRIEKLAHSVKEKMRDAVAPGPALESPLSPLNPQSSALP